MKTRVFRESSQITGLIRSKTWTDEQLKMLQADIMQGVGRTIARTGGFKKIRLAAEGAGKRGGWRVVFADYPECGFTALVFAYTKGTKENLTAAEEARLRSVKTELDAEVKAKYGCWKKET